MFITIFIGYGKSNKTLQCKQCAVGNFFKKRDTILITVNRKCYVKIRKILSRDKCAADGIFQKFDPTITFFCEFCDYFWFSKLQGASSPPFAVGRPWPCTHISHTTKVYTPTSTFAMSHFTVWKKILDETLPSCPADLCFIIFHPFEFVSIKDVHSDLEQKYFISLLNWYTQLSDLSSKC